MLAVRDFKMFHLSKSTCMESWR